MKLTGFLHPTICRQIPKCLRNHWNKPFTGGSFWGLLFTCCTVTLPGPLAERWISVFIVIETAVACRYVYIPCPWILFLYCSPFSVRAQHEISRGAYLTSLLIFISELKSIPVPMQNVWSNETPTPTSVHPVVFLDFYDF